MIGNPLLLGGLAAAAAPIIIHIAHRRKAKQVNWGAMKFLLEMLAKSSRRLFIEEWLLLSVRVLLLALVSGALVRPAIDPPDKKKVSEQLERKSRVAAVILFDDSVSSAFGREKPTLEAMKELAVEYIDGLKVGEKGDEVSILRLSELDLPPPDPLYDLGAAQELIRGIEATDAASNLPALFEAGLIQLARHISPNRELVLVTDGRHQGWRLDERARWAEIQRRVAGDEQEKAKKKKKNKAGKKDEEKKKKEKEKPAADDGLLGQVHPRLIVLTPETKAADDNLGITALTLDRALVPAGRPVAIRTRVRHHGEHPPPIALLRVLVNERVIDERAVELKAGQIKEISVSHVFDEPGSYVVQAVIQGARDALERDDRRTWAVTVAKQLPVLLVEGTEGTGLDGSLGILGLALDPFLDGKGLFETKRVSVNDLVDVRLEDYRVIVLGDLPALDPEALSALERFVVAGGGVFVSLGPNTDVEVANRFWARSGDGFLPAPLGELKEPDKPATPAHAEASDHPALQAFTGKASEAWKSGKIRAYHLLDTKAIKEKELETILTLDTGHPLLIERRRGLGTVMLFTTSLDLSWGDFCVQPAFLPLVRGALASLGANVSPPRNLTPGSRLRHPAPAAGEPTIHAPDGEIIEAERGDWEDRPVIASKTGLHQAGVYTVRVANVDKPEFYAVALDPSESELDAIPDEDRKRALGRMDPVSVTDARQLKALIDPTAGERLELWRYMLMAAIALLFFETYLTRRQAVQEARSNRPSANHPAPVATDQPVAAK